MFWFFPSISDYSVHSAAVLIVTCQILPLDLYWLSVFCTSSVPRSSYGVRVCTWTGTEIGKWFRMWTLDFQLIDCREVCIYTDRGQSWQVQSPMYTGNRPRQWWIFHLFRYHIAWLNWRIVCVIFHSSCTVSVHSSVSSL